MLDSIFATLTPAALGRATLMLLGFVATLFVLTKIVPGPRHPGAKLRDGTQLTYKLNGLAIWLIVSGAVAVATISFDFSLAPLARHFWPLFVVANAFAFGGTVLLYLLARRKGLGKERGVLAGLFYGAELNPTWWGVDLKMFSYKPSLIGLGLINASFAYLQYETHGSVSQPMMLFQAFYFIYLTNYFQFEYGMLFTWDIIAENFGWMLVWGDYALVPFFYCIGARFMVERLEPLHPALAASLCLMFVGGLWMFRGANEQKHRYKRNPKVHIWGKPAETIGGKLLVSGFWGIGRHLNYTGEITVYLSWSLLTGFSSPWPYLLPAWLIGLLTHRAWRDDRRCREKYGPLWDEYCQRARFRMVPFIY